MSAQLNIGVLALQGDWRKHFAILEECDVTPVEVRDPSDLSSIDGLIIPGGESTTMSMLIKSSGLEEPLAKMLKNDMPVFGTCAGMILLASKVIDGRSDQIRFGVLDAVVRRNGFGRQVASFEEEVDIEMIGPDPMRAVFIRAPLVEGTGPNTQILARCASQIPVVLRQRNALGCSFHPELTEDFRLHKMFISIAQDSNNVVLPFSKD
jgi:5'-phosphate synthase pdxT subunit